MKWTSRSVTFLAFLAVSFAGCAFQGPISGQNQLVAAQPDTGQLVDYLHFAGISYGDTLDDVVTLFGEPTSVDLDDGQNSFPGADYARYQIEGEDCLDVGYQRATRRVESLQVKCTRLRNVLLGKQLDDPKLALLLQPRDSIFDRYGSPESTVTGIYDFNFETEGERDGSITFYCFDFWDSRCKEISVQWFYPMPEAELSRAIESIQQDLARVSEPKRKKIKQFLELTQAAAQSKQALNAFIAAMKPAFPDAHEEVWKEVLADIDFQKLIDLLVPVYDKHLTEQELDDLIAFFSSPSGRSFVEKQPEIMIESFAIGQQWGRELAEELRQRLEARRKKVTGP